MSISFAFKRFSAAALAALLLALAVTEGATAATTPPTIEISGKAYRFNHMNTFISGAVIKVREDTSLGTVADANGDYVLTVPDNTNVTPYIESGNYTPGKHYNEIDLQTFHPRGQNIVNANFQVPTDEEYNLLASGLDIPVDENNRPRQCAIVTTSSARNVRDVDYQTFWDRTPHGVAGTTAVEFPALDGPVYFNEAVIPDPTKTATSEDGGIVWPIVPTGAYRIVGSNPTAQFASLLATCAPGRVVNANPPWGMYELSPGEAPLAASNVAGNVNSAKAFRKGKKNRKVKFNITSGEALSMKAVLKQSGKKFGSKSVSSVGVGNFSYTFKVKSKAKPGKAQIKVTLTDASGVSFTTTNSVKVPKVIKKKTDKKHKKNKKKNKKK